MAENYISQRLSFAGDLCTVRYVGAVDGTKGRWIGVEWDDTTRGKHDGQANDKRYFKCKSTSVTAGSFVRPNRAHDTTRSFLDALKYKYAPESIELAYAVGDVQRQQPIVISGKEVEEVGFDKVRKQLAELGELRIVILDGLCIRSGNANDPSPDVGATCPKIVELDLSRNLFESWNDYILLVAPLRDLQVLKIEGNRLREIDLTADEVASHRRILGGLRELSLQNTLLSWSEVCLITSLCVSLKSLSLANNEYTSIPPTISLNKLPQSITSINLEWNDFTTLSDLQPLQKLRNLAKLTLKYNQISTLGSVESGSELKFSPSLIELDISYNNITDWSLIDNLQSSFPGLTALRISHNPLYLSLRHAETGTTLSAADGFMLTIARLPKLRSLNYTAMSAKDRLNGESFYLSQIAAELRQTSETQEGSIIARHPRWQELCEEYGRPQIMRRGERRIDPNSLQARLITCRFHRSSPPSGDGLPNTWVVELPASLSMYAVHGLVGRAFKLAPATLTLVYETGEADMVQKRKQTFNDSVSEQSWNSDEDASEIKESHTSADTLYEVELFPGTRPLITWLDETEVNIRVDDKIPSRSN